MSSNDRAKAVDVVFTSGVRQDLEGKIAPPGTLMQADGVEFDELGRLRRRDGFAQQGLSVISKTNIVDAPIHRLAQTPRGERLFFTNANVFQHLQSTNKVCEAGLDNQRNALRATMESSESIAGDEVGAMRTCDCVAIGGYYIVTYAQTNVTSGILTLYLDIIDTATNARVITHFDLGAIGSIQPRVVACGGTSKAFVLWNDGGTNLRKVIIDFTTSVSVGGVTNLVTDVYGLIPVFDADAMTSGSVIVYSQFSGGTHKARIITVDSTAAITASFTWLANGGVANWTPSVLAIHGDTRISNQVRAAGYDPATGFVEMEITTSGLVHSSRARSNPGLANNATQMTVIAASGSASLLLFSNYTSTVAGNPRGHLYVWYITAGSLSTQTVVANYSLAGKCYRDGRGDLIYAFARFNGGDGLQSHILMLDFGNALFGPYPVMHFANGRIPLDSDNATTGIGGVADLGGGAFRATFAINIGASSISGNEIASYSFQSLSTQRFLSTPANGELHIGSGTPTSYDGQRLVENSFYSYPIININNITPQNVGGFMPQGTYSYSAVYEWTDALGNRHQSAPAPPITVDMSGAPFAGGTNMVLVSIPCYHPTRKQVPLNTVGTFADESVPVRVIIYRSKANGSILYRMPIASVNNTASVANNTVVGDVYSDASISVNEVLYAGTQGRGELFTTAPPPTKFLATHGQRLWGVDCEFSERIWATKTLEQFTNPGYNPGLQIIIPGAGKINGLAGQDGKLYALATNGIYIATYGDGPDNAGVGSFPSPQLITAAATCSEPRSVLVGSNGIYFQGDDQWGAGFYLIRRGDGEPISIGKPLRKELAAFPVCRGAVDRVDKSRIEFLMVDNDVSPTASMLMYYHYDYLGQDGIGQWTTAYIVTPLTSIGLWKAGSNLPTTAIATDSVSTNIGLQDPTTIRDFGAHWTASIETADLRPGGLVGYGRIAGVTLLGTADGTPSTLTIEASYDSSFTWPEKFAFAPATEIINQPILRRWDMATSKLPDGGSVRLRITDPPTPDEDQTQGGQFFHGLSLEYEPLGGNARLSNTQRGS